MPDLSRLFWDARVHLFFLAIPFPTDIVALLSILLLELRGYEHFVDSYDL